MYPGFSPFFSAGDVLACISVATTDLPMSGAKENNFLLFPTYYEEPQLPSAQPWQTWHCLPLTGEREVHARSWEQVTSFGDIMKFLLQIE